MTERTISLIAPASTIGSTSQLSFIHEPTTGQFPFKQKRKYLPELLSCTNNDYLWTQIFRLLRDVCLVCYGVYTIYCLRKIQFCLRFNRSKILIKMILHIKFNFAIPSIAFYSETVMEVRYAPVFWAQFPGEMVVVKLVGQVSTLGPQQLMTGSQELDYILSLIKLSYDKFYTELYHVCLISGFNLIVSCTRVYLVRVKSEKSYFRDELERK